MNSHISNTSAAVNTASDATMIEPGSPASLHRSQAEDATWLSAGLRSWGIHAFIAFCLLERSGDVPMTAPEVHERAKFYNLYVTRKVLKFLVEQGVVERTKTGTRQSWRVAERYRDLPRKRSR